MPNARPSREEQVVGIAATFYDARSTVRALLGDRFNREMRAVVRLLRETMAQFNEGVIEASTRILKEDSTSAQFKLAVLAGVVELCEADERRHNTRRRTRS